MKKVKLVPILCLIFIMLTGIINNTQAQVPVPSITIQRIPAGAPGVPGYTEVPVVLSIKPPSAFIPAISNSYPNNSSVATYSASAIGSGKFSATIEGQTSTGIYYLPTTLNEEVFTTYPDFNFPAPLNYAYSVSIRNIGNNQYTMKVAKLTCNGCPPISN